MGVLLATILAVTLAAAPALGAGTLPPTLTQSGEGKSQVMLLVPAERLDELQRQMAQAGLGRDAVIVMPFQQFSQVADIQGIQGTSAAAGGSAIASPSREQTSVQSSPSTSESQGAGSGSSSLTAQSGTPGTSSGSSSSTTGTTTGQTTARSSSAGTFFENKTILLVPHDQLQAIGQAAPGNGQEILVVLPYEQFNQVADASRLQSTQSSAGVSPSREQTSASGGPGGSVTGWEFHRDHVMLLVPQEKIQSFSQISTSGGRPIYVLMPLQQFEQMSGVRSSATTAPGREQASFQPGSSGPAAPSAGTSLPPAYAETGPTFYLHNLQEANSVLHWFPAAGGTIIELRDGSTLLVPDSVKIRGALQTGARIRGEYEQRGGRNLVTWLEVVGATNNN